VGRHTERSGEHSNKLATVADKDGQHSWVLRCAEYLAVNKFPAIVLLDILLFIRSALATVHANESLTVISIALYRETSRLTVRTSTRLTMTQRNTAMAMLLNSANQ